MFATFATLERLAFANMPGCSPTWQASQASRDGVVKFNTRLEFTGDVIRNTSALRDGVQIPVGSNEQKEL
jgi:hypothetical protein